MSDLPLSLETAEERITTRGAVDKLTGELSQFIAASIDAARASAEPFHHLVFGRVFPDDVYAAMLRALPQASDYRPMHGRSKGNDLADGTHTRVKIDLFPEYIWHLPAPKRAVWNFVSDALRSREVQAALMRKLAPGLKRRFGDGYANVRMFPVPVLTRDIAGYLIRPHTDTHWKAITVQLYLPPDEALTHIGTIFHGRGTDGSLPKHTQMPFAPNTGYAFAVDKDTWHSADPLGPEVKTRDSILLTYFADDGLLRYPRNRGKRFGNFLLNELRFWTRW
jgi:hypothetical protein